MNDTERRRYEMFARVRDFGAEHTADFAANSVGQQRFNDINNIVSELEGLSSSKISGQSTARQGTATRASARAAVREAIDDISRVARAMAGEITGIDDKFRQPRKPSDEQLISTARSFITDATPFSAQFIAYELPANFLTELGNDITALEEAIGTQSSGIGDHVAANAAIDDAIDRGTMVVRQLDAIVKIKYKDNPGVRAEWTSVSHTERSPRRSGPTPPPPPETPPPTSPPG